MRGYLILKMSKWADIELYNPNTPKAHIGESEDGVIGFCPVFDDMKKAIGFAGDVMFVQPINIGKE